jgi:hypothetical protein
MGMIWKDKQDVVTSFMHGVVSGPVNKLDPKMNANDNVEFAPVALAA